MKAPLPVIGEVFDFSYPFVRDTFHGGDIDVDGITVTETPTWKPGTRCETWTDQRCLDYTENTADAMGRCIITVVSVHQPVGYPTRVFFTRKWVNPDGKCFGKTKLRITTSAAFHRLIRGYRVPFVMAQPQAVSR